MSTVTLSNATFDDIHALASMELRAYQSDEVFNALFGQCSPDDVVHFYSNSIKEYVEHSDGKKFAIKATNSGGTIVGLALWEVKPVGKPAGDKNEIVWPQGTCLENAREFVSLHELSADHDYLCESTALG